jgi:hypothetical protein
VDWLDIPQPQPIANLQVVVVQVLFMETAEMAEARTFLLHRPKEVLVAVVLVVRGVLEILVQAQELVAAVYKMAQLIPLVAMVVVVVALPAQGVEEMGEAQAAEPLQILYKLVTQPPYFKLQELPQAL